MADTFEQIKMRNIAKIRQTVSPNLLPESRDNVVGVMVDLLSQNNLGTQIAIDNARRDAFIQTAVGTRLDEFGAVFGVERKASGIAKGRITFTAALAQTIPAGTAVSTEDGLGYTTDERVDVSGAEASIFITATREGEAYNLENNTILIMVTDEETISGLSELVSGGSDIEDDESYRTRIKLNLRNPPSGGTESDWIRWTLDFPDKTVGTVTATKTGTAEVTIYPTIIDNENNLPTTTDVSNITAYLENFRPIGTELIVKKAAAVEVAVTFTELSVNDNVVQASVRAALIELFNDRAKVGQTFRLSWITEAIGNVIGENYHLLSAPTTDIAITAGQLAVLGDITFPDASA